MSFTIAPTFSQVFQLPDESEGYGCCGCFRFRRGGELVLDPTEERLVRVLRASPEQRKRVTEWLVEMGNNKMREFPIPAEMIPENELRARAGSVLCPKTPLTDEGLERFAKAVQDLITITGINSLPQEEDIEIIDLTPKGQKDINGEDSL